MMDNNETIKKCYEEICNGCIGKKFKGNKKKFELSQLSHFTAMAGKNYWDSGCKKIMFIGRAVNGWSQYQGIKNADDFGQKSLDAMINSKFDWVAQDGENGMLRNNEISNGKYYFLDTSPFWRVVKNIFSKVTGVSNTGRWVDYIAWSNLYKISFYETGNPSLKMIKAQLPGCRNLLKQEIEEYRPDYILLVVGWDWFTEFNDNGLVFQGVKFIDRNRYRGNDTNGVFVEAKAKYLLVDKEIPVIITCRPECRDESKFVEDVLKNLPK